MPLPNPVILLPGITATYLRDMYPLPPESVWEVMPWDRDYRRVSLHPDTQTVGSRRLEALQPARIVADQLYEVAYEELVDELRDNLSTSDREPVPVYPFGHDWRQPLNLIEAELDRFIDEVIERTCLMRHYFADGYPARRQVNLVGHSMGGLIVAGHLQRKGGDARIGKIVTLAAPFRGSIEPLVKIVTGNANLGVTPPSSRDREAARLTPALYHLLPSFDAGNIVLPPQFGTSLFQPAVWQRSILQTIRRYILDYGKDPQNPGDENAVFAALLQEAMQHRNGIETLDLAAIGFDPNDWLCVCGIGSKTRVRAAVVAATDSTGNPVPEFRFDPANDLKNDPGTDLTGDGTVPLLGALPTFLPREMVVCVTPDDFDFWEGLDIILMKAGGGFHGLMPTMDMIHRLIVNFFRPGTRGDYWGQPAPGIADADWAPPTSPPFKIPLIRR